MLVLLLRGRQGRVSLHLHAGRRQRWAPRRRGHVPMPVHQRHGWRRPSLRAVRLCEVDDGGQAAVVAHARSRSRSRFRAQAKPRACSDCARARGVAPPPAPRAVAVMGWVLHRMLARILLLILQLAHLAH